MTEPISVSRRIEAPAAVIFAILADPARHPDLDGSRMLTEPVDPKPLEKPGDVFTMNMHNKLFGDYVMVNTVAEFEPGRRISWDPATPEQGGNPSVPPGSIRWSYELTPDGDGATLVTETYDCSRAPAELQEFVRDGELWRKSMGRTLENLDRLAAGAS